MTTTEGAVDSPLAPDLVRLIKRNAYMRRPNTARRRFEKASYKRGWEVRLVLRNEAEIEAAGRLIQDSGLKAGRPFTNHRQWVIPLYGRKTVELIKANTGIRKKRARKK